MRSGVNASVGFWAARVAPMAFSRRFQNFLVWEVKKSTADPSERRQR